tara:strand:- start:1414 stop:1605 length:192 start_codon:yes stop_codon:yes gene_type:complete
MKDKEIIKRLGGVKVVAQALGYEYNTVYNWTTRGISAFAKVKHPDQLMPKCLDDIKPLVMTTK